MTGADGQGAPSAGPEGGLETCVLRPFGPKAQEGAEGATPCAPSPGPRPPAPAAESGAQPGTRSNAGTPSGTWWKLCLSMVKITIWGPP